MAGRYSIRTFRRSITDCTKETKSSLDVFWSSSALSLSIFDLHCRSHCRNFATHHHTYKRCGGGLRRFLGVEADVLFEKTEWANKDTSKSRDW